MRIVHDSTELSEEEGAVLEARLLGDPDDVLTRVRLVGFYFLRASAESHHRRAEHVTWLATHRPDIGLGGFGYIEEARTPEGHETARQAWIASAERTDDMRVLANAGTFLGFNRPEEAEPIYRRAVALEPANGKWRSRLAHSLTKRADWADEPEERCRLARAAIEEFQVALTFAREDWVALGIRIDVVNAAVLAEDWTLVRETAERVLVDNETCTRTFEYGNAIHRANIALGRAALASDDVKEAAVSLVRAGKTPGSPQLNSFGPDRELACDLLERGEREAVLTYLADCSRFWSGREALLAGWRAAIERGEPTRLDCCDDEQDDP